MRPHQIIASLSAEEFSSLITELEQENADVVTGTVVAAAQVLKFRPKFLMKQPKAKRLNSVKGALSRVTAVSLAEELLAVYVLKCRLPLLEEWLDLMELEHEEGILTQDEIPCPDAGVVTQKVEAFRKGDDPEARLLLLRVFNAQAAIDWPPLGELLAEA